VPVVGCEDCGDLSGGVEVVDGLRDFQCDSLPVNPTNTVLVCARIRFKSGTTSDKSPAEQATSPQSETSPTHHPSATPTPPNTTPTAVQPQSIVTKHHTPSHHHTAPTDHTHTTHGRAPTPHGAPTAPSSSTHPLLTRSTYHVYTARAPSPSSPQPKARETTMDHRCPSRSVTQ
jgi:hypothetical protein